jgi:hypothetical protein
MIVGQILLFSHENGYYLFKSIDKYTLTVELSNGGDDIKYSKFYQANFYFKWVPSAIID